MYLNCRRKIKDRRKDKIWPLMMNGKYVLKEQRTMTRRIADRRSALGEKT